MTSRLNRWLLLLVSLAFPAVAQDRPEPVAQSLNSILSGYDTNVHTVFREAYAPDVEVRAVVRPSFQPEYAVGLRRGAHGHEVFLIRPSSQIWGYTSAEMMEQGHVVVVSENRVETAQETERTRRSLPPSVSDMPIARCSVAVDEETAAALIRAWRRMLEPPGLGPREFGFDGVTYRFSMEIGGRQLEGEVWDGSPSQLSQPQLADAMADYCTTRSRSIQTALWSGGLLAALSLVPAILLLSAGFRRLTGRRVPGMDRLGSVSRRNSGLTYSIVSFVLVSLLVYAAFTVGSSREMLGLAQVIASAR